MLLHNDLTGSSLFHLLRYKKIAIAGNKSLKIYGTLHCKAGKRMEKKNRVFFKSIEEAVEAGYRPCAICSHGDYKDWKLFSKYQVGREV